MGAFLADEDAGIVLHGVSDMALQRLQRNIVRKGMFARKQVLLALKAPLGGGAGTGIALTCFQSPYHGSKRNIVLRHAGKPALHQRGRKQRDYLVRHVKILALSEDRAWAIRQRQPLIGHAAASPVLVATQPARYLSGP